MCGVTELQPADGTAVILHLIEAARVWARSSGEPGPATALAAWVGEIEARYGREKIAPAPVGWDPRKWRVLVKGDRVELGGIEAEIEWTETQTWHVDPDEDHRRWHEGPEIDHCKACGQRCRKARGWFSPPLKHTFTKVKLVGRDQVYKMPPEGEVETLRGEYGRDLDAVAGYRSPLAEEVHDVMTDWARDAADTLAAAGLGPVEVKR